MNDDRQRHEPGGKPLLVATIGLQASGKTTWARQWVSMDPENRVRVERDDLRRMLGNGFVKKNELMISEMRNSLIEGALKNGRSVVVSDTNFPWRVLRELRNIARVNGADFHVVDLTDVPVEECIRRDRHRDNSVGEGVIRDFYNRYLRGKDFPYPLPPEENSFQTWEPYTPSSWYPPAILVDIDGTLALMNGRSPYDWSRVFEDSVNEPVVNHLLNMRHRGNDVCRIILMSGRDEVSRAETERWLRFHGIPYDELHMRAKGDMRRDDLVKYELFNDHVRNNYRVEYVLDDRDQVVKMWRDIGLSCWQVAPGNF